MDKQKKARKRIFTLVELLVVLLILGVVGRTCRTKVYGCTEKR